jgi:Fur family ferric uptake transcriptional regulator
MTHNTVDYVGLMHQRGFRVTPQRQIILDSICEGGGHTTVEEVYERVRERAPRINLATVYRTVEFMSELGLVIVSNVGGDRMVCEIAGKEPHHHLVCKSCHYVTDIPHEIVDQFLAAVEQNSQFELQAYHLVLFGTCKDCQNTDTGAVS